MYVCLKGPAFRRPRPGLAELLFVAVTWLAGAGTSKIESRTSPASEFRRFVLYVFQCMLMLSAGGEVVGICHGK